MKKKEKIELRSLNQVELIALIQRLGFEGYRGKQLHQWIYRKAVRSFDEMTNIPKELLNSLKEISFLGGIKYTESVESSDGTKKFIHTLYDDLKIQSVLMPGDNRTTLCISTQVGCPLNCSFCLTGKMGFERNLTIAEIVDQVLHTRYYYVQHPLSMNIVVMGMGEPLLNLDNVIPALRLIVSPQDIGISPRRVTLSTVGIPEGLKRLAKEDIGINLAISLHSAYQTKRSELVPINKKYPLSEIMKELNSYPLPKSRRITFEYILLKGINDSLQDAKKLAQLLNNRRSKINLILYNEIGDERYKRPDEKTIEEFANFLREMNFTVAIRYSKGEDIKAACGQLAL